MSQPTTPPKVDTPKPPVAPCYVKDQPAGGLSVTFQIDAVTAKRIKLRAGTMDISRYIYENILKRAVMDHCW